MDHVIDEEFRNICREIQRDHRTVDEWAEIEADDWFQTEHYCGGFDATEMEFTFSVMLDCREYCFQLTLQEALPVADGHLTNISLQESPWA